MRRARADRPWWAVAVAALLVVNLGVLIIVLTRDDSPDTPPPAAIAPQIAPQVASPSAAAQPTPARVAAMPAPPPPTSMPTNPAVRSLADEAGVDMEPMPDDLSVDPALAGAASVPQGPPLVRPITPPSVSPASNPATFASRARAPVDESEMLPTHESLIVSGTKLPDMRLDIHVYSANPAERFVFVNMRKYVEGQNLSEGPVLERITSDGAILNQQGTRFLLPRQ